MKNKKNNNMGKAISRAERAQQVLQQANNSAQNGTTATTVYTYHTKSQNNNDAMPIRQADWRTTNNNIKPSLPPERKIHGSPNGTYDWQNMSNNGVEMM